MKSIKILVCSIVLLSAHCQKEGKNCHHAIKTINNSGNQIVVAIQVIGSESKCKLDGNFVEIGESYNYEPFNGCIESRIKDKNEKIVVFIVDPIKFNDENVSYSCDSLEFKNKILKTYSLNLEDLKSTDFTITYE